MYEEDFDFYQSIREDVRLLMLHFEAPTTVCHHTDMSFKLDLLGPKALCVRKSDQSRNMPGALSSYIISIKELFFFKYSGQP